MYRLDPDYTIASAEVTPEARLWAAVLETIWEDYWYEGRCQWQFDLEARTVRARAAMDLDNGVVEAICDALGIDVGYFARMVRAASPEDTRRAAEEAARRRAVAERLAVARERARRLRRQWETRSRRR